MGLRRCFARGKKHPDEATIIGRVIYQAERTDMSQGRRVDQYILRTRIQAEINKVAAAIGLAAFVVGGALWFLLSPKTGYVVAATLLVTSFIVSLYSAFIE